MAKEYVRKVTDGPIQGQVVLKILPYLERKEKAKEISDEAKENGLAYVRLLHETLEKHLVSIDLKAVVTGEEIKTLEDLGYFKEGADLIEMLGTELILGPSLGNSQEPSSSRSPKSTDDDDSSATAT